MRNRFLRKARAGRFPALACAALILSAGAASAQINPFTGADLAVSSSDLAIIEEIAGGLIEGKVAPTGTRLRWHNGETHHEGTIEVLGSSERDGQPCHKLRYRLPLKTHAKYQAFDLTWCKTAEGDWKIAANKPSGSIHAA